MYNGHLRQFYHGSERSTSRRFSPAQHVLRWREARDRGRSDLVRGCPAP